MSDAAPAGPSPAGTDDWTVQVADRIESVVGTVRDKTVVPVTKVARGLVFGLLAGVAATTALIVAVVAAVRLSVYWPWHPDGRKIWVTYALLSAIFLLAGAFAWGRRTPRAR